MTGDDAVGGETLPGDMRALARRWRELTAVPRKAQLFLRESYFRHGWAAATEVFGTATPSTLQRVGAVVLKPDAIVGRRGRLCLEFLADHGFRPLVARAFSYSPYALREIWRYQWNIATLDRIALGDALYTATSSLLVLLHDERANEHEPATVRIAGLKGSSLPGERTGDELRSVLGALNRMVVVVHCADEPVDIVRECGILFGPDELRELFTSLRTALRADPATAHAQVAAALDAVERSAPSVPLSIPTALEDLRAELRAAGAAAGAASALLDQARGGQALSWERWRATADAAGMASTSWPSLLVGTEHIRHDLPGTRCIIAESGRSRWLAGEGHRVA